MIKIRTLKNGLVVIVEQMPHLESAAYELLIPGGILADPNERIGEALLLGELISRGAGPFDSKGLSDKFDSAGIRHGEGAGFDRYSLRGSLLTEKLPVALELVAAMALEPKLPEDDLESVKSLHLQDILALKDSPSRLAMHELGKRYYPAPYDRPSVGTEAGILNSSIEAVRESWERMFRPDGAILSVAGNVVHDDIFELAERLFGSWSGKSFVRPSVGVFPQHKNFHVNIDSAQLQIVFAFPSAKFGERLYYAAKVASGLLSGGSFGRLFIEVREKRGLCYSVYSRHTATKDIGLVTAYAGTTPERAHETLEVMLSVFNNVKGTVTPEERSRAIANIKSGLVIGEESPGSRASSNSSDYFIDKRVRELDEIASAIEKVSLQDIDEYFDTYSASSHMLLTLGSKEITK